MHVFAAHIYYWSHTQSPLQWIGDADANYMTLHSKMRSVCLLGYGLGGRGASSSIYCGHHVCVLRAGTWSHL